MEQYRHDHSDAASELDRVICGRLPEGWDTAVPTWREGESVSGRDAGGATAQRSGNGAPRARGWLRGRVAIHQDLHQRRRDYQWRRLVRLKHPLWGA